MAAVQFATALNMADDPQTRSTDDCALGPEREIRILSVSSEEDDHAALFQILDELPFVVTPARTCREAAVCLGIEQFGIILCECKLPDGNWSEILNRISGAAEEPLLIVTSRVADVSLWAEVLNLGGYDLLAKPFSRQEVRHVLTSAWVQRANPVRGNGAAGSS
jgi:DNA-binding NtrC family response regulator